MTELDNERKEQREESMFRSASVLMQRWKEGTFGEILEDWRWILQYSKRYKGAIVFYTLLGIASSSLGLVGSVASKYLIDIVTGYQMEKLSLLIGIMAGSTLFSLLLGSVINRISVRLSVDINNDIQADIFDQILDADWLAVSRFSNGDLLNRFNSDVSTVSSNAVGWLPTVIIAAYNFLATFAVIWYYSKVMALLSLGTAPVMLLMSKLLVRRQREYQKKAKEISSEMVSFEVETFYGFDTVKSFGAADQFGRKMREWQRRLKETTLQYNLFAIKTNVLLSLMGFLVQTAAFLYCLWLLWSNAITYGTMTLFLTQRARLSTAFNNVIGIIPSFLSSSVSAHRIRELVELPKEAHLPESRELDGCAPEGYSIRMRDLEFAYVEDNRVITDSRFMARPGEIVALVGSSGEGKTTLIRLILGLVAPQKGQVAVQTANGREVPVNAQTRHLFAYVPQGNTIMAGTIAENLRLGKENATDEEIVEALKMACAWDFVRDLPDTIQFKLGERGRGLSEGQAQRIAIARALLRDAPVLLLDEATSALDVATERKVLRNIVGQKPNKTCIVTTHRPSVLDLCQRVYRVGEKRVVELDAEEAGRLSMDY